MGMFNTAIVTNKGQELLTKSIAGLCTLEFTKIALSENVLSEPLADLTDIGQIKQSEPIASKDIRHNVSVTFGATFTNKNLKSGYYVRNIGLFALDENGNEILYSVSTADESTVTADYMPAYDNTFITSLLVEIVAVISNTDDVSVVVDPAGYVTLKQFNALENDFKVCQKVAVENLSELVKDADKLNNSLESPIIYLKDEGYTSQNGTPTPTAPIDVVGAGVTNLLNITVGASTSCGISCTPNGGGIYTLNGVANGNADFTLALNHSAIRGNNKLKRNCLILSGSYDGTINHMSYTVGWGNGVDTPINESELLKSGLDYVHFSVKVASGTVIDNLRIGMIVAEYTDVFVPYGKYVLPIKMSGKNFSPYNQLKWTYSSGGFVIDNKSIYLKANKTYTLQCDNATSTSGKGLEITFMDVTGTKNVSKTFMPSDLVNGTITFTPSADIHTFKMWANEQITIANFQIHEGTTRQPYSPYVEPITANIPIDDPLYEGDYIEIYADGSGEIVRKYKTFDIMRWSWFTNVLTTSKEARYPKPSDAKLNGNIYCTIAKKVEQTWGIDEVGIMTYGGDNYNEICVRIPSDAGDIDYLCTVVYELDEPIREPLTAEQVNEFKKLHTFNGTTHINSDGTATVRYYCDKVGKLQAEVDELKSALLALTSEGSE